MRGGYDLPLPSGDVATQKAFRYYHGFGSRNAEYGAGIGLLALGGFGEIDIGTFWTLRYARVGGVAYGAPIPGLPTAAAPDPGEVAAALTARASPNPVAGPFALALDLPVTGPVAVEAFDALGRRVHHEERTLPAGALALDASAWAPGVYVVRVTTAGGAASARVVRR